MNCISKKPIINDLKQKIHHEMWQNDRRHPSAKGLEIGLHAMAKHNGIRHLTRRELS